MVAKIIYAACCLGAAGFFVYKKADVDTTVFPYPARQLQTMLMEAKTTLPRRDGPGQIQLWGTGRTAKGVALNLQYASWAPVLKCEAVITAIAPDRSRVVPDCGASAKSDSAMARTQDELRVPMFEEHIQATLNKRAFDRKAVDRQESASVLKNLGGMQREALKMADEDAQRLQAIRSGR
jgi:hypothetical protein